MEKDNLKDPSKIKLYWSHHTVNGRKNFGDWLSPVLCAHLSGCEIEYAKPNKSNLVAIGSILHRVKHHFWNRRTHIWGTGFMYSHEPVNGYHYFHAVRGKKTAELIRGTRIEALGEPGLLVDSLLSKHSQIPKRHQLGIIPHHLEQKNPELLATLAKHKDIYLIDVLSDTSQFLQEVASCEVILSSSLHGLATADSFGIPNAWIKISDTVRGDGFKFLDYYSVFDIVPEPISLFEISNSSSKYIQDSYKRIGLEQIKKDLISAFPYPRGKAPNRDII